MKNKFPILIFLVSAAWANGIAQVTDTLSAPVQITDNQQDTTPITRFDTLKTTDSIGPALTETPALAADTLAQTAAKKKGALHRFWKADYPNPNKALYLSAAVPGGGQIYNRRWWKAPLVWGADAWLIYASQFNRRQYKRYRDAYIAELEDMEHEFSNTGLNANDLKRIRDQYDKRKQLSYIGIFGVHLIQAAEAFVDCHLKTFDVSDDLSFKFKPSVQPQANSGGPVLGFGVALVFR